MKKDRFLQGILIFIAVLVVASLVLFFAGGAQQDYLSETSPDAVVHNYTLALTNGDFEKAYEYVAEGEDKPTSAEFIRHFTQIEPLRNAGLRIESTDLFVGEAVVRVTVVWGSSDPFDSGSRYDDSALLVLQEEDWKIQQMPYPFWNFSWSENILRQK